MRETGISRGDIHLSRKYAAAEAIVSERIERIGVAASKTAPA